MPTIPAILTKASNLMNAEVIKTFKDQGHSLTGATEASLKTSIEVSGGKTHAVGTAVGYSGIVNRGITASRIPFGGQSTGAKTSQYLQGLANYAKLRMGATNDKKALSIAFAIAAKHKKEGMSTQASKRFSKTGERQRFIEDASKRTLPKVNAIIQDGCDDIMDGLFNKIKSGKI
jgi:hypothetical protein